MRGEKSAIRKPHPSTGMGLDERGGGYFTLDFQGLISEFEVVFDFAEAAFAVRFVSVVCGQVELKDVRAPLAEVRMQTWFTPVESVLL